MARGKKLVQGSRDPIREVRLDARALVTFDEDDFEPDALAEALQVRKLKGAIVRLRPPPGAEDAYVEEVKKAILDEGAASVTALPRRKGAVVPDEVVERPARARASIRQVVTELVAASNTQDRDKLRALCEETMAAEGL